jgi:hypothetical protein
MKMRLHDRDMRVGCVVSCENQGPQYINYLHSPFMSPYVPPEMHLTPMLFGKVISLFLPRHPMLR